MSQLTKAFKMYYLTYNLQRSGGICSKPPFNVKDKTHAYKYTKSVILVNSKPVKHPQMYQKISGPCLPLPCHWP